MALKQFLITMLMLLPLEISARNKPEQIKIPLVEEMPDFPSPYKMKEWKSIAVKQDRLLFDHNAKGTFLPLIWIDNSRVNCDMEAFGLPSYVGSLRNFEKGIHFESLPTIGSVLSASLMGIDKTSYDGYDYVSMLRQLYNPTHHLVLNSVSRAVGKTFWYEIFPTVAFSMLADLYPGKEDIAEVMKSCCDTWNNAMHEMLEQNGKFDFNFTAYDFNAQKGYYNGRWREPDAAAGIAWLEYMGWVQWGNEKYLESAMKAMEFLQDRPAEEGTYYEILMPYGAYLAVRMNAKLGTCYDELKFINWCFDGNNSDRDGWGVICENWEGYDVHGLVGQKKWEQYAFAMNTFSQAAALVPIVKYNAAYSYSIGKWMLNLSNAARLFYSDEHPRNRQSSALWDGDPDHVICYEGLRKNLDNGNHFSSFKGILAEKGPYAIGDQVKYMKSMTDICIYASAWVGMLASIVDTTDVEGILQLDCNATDFFGDRTKPYYLLYNPYGESKEVSVKLPEGVFKLVDNLTGKVIGKKMKSGDKLTLPAKSAITFYANQK